MSAGLTVSEDPVAAASAQLAGHLRARLERAEHVRLAVAGGSALAALGPALEVLGEDCARLRLTWVDERCVPVADDASNRGATHRALAGLAPPSMELPLWLDEENVEEALSRVRHGLKTHFDDALDVTLLGMGADGHIASLFVGRAVDADRVAHIPDSPKPPPRRMTLTRALLSTASAHVLLAKGESKRAALRRLMTGDERLPAAGLTGLSVVTDLDLGAGT